MNLKTKLILIVTMTAALFFGFLQLFCPAYNFERLHIFLFNLCSGGTAILIYSEGKKGASLRAGFFFLLSFCYAVFAFLQMYRYAISVAMILALLVEAVRIKKFSFVPWNFFTPSSSTSEKFHHASLLCLSLALIISALVIYNHQYGGLILSPKLTLDIFFLGFSFPVSLITMSVMYGKMKESMNRPTRIFEDASFWIINLGVIIFFLFILMQMFIPELIIAGILFVTVVIIFAIYLKLGFREQPKAFLSSGMAFLIMTAITGIIYIPLSLYIPSPPNGKLLLKLHALISLYGWNLNGIAVICRYHDFPIKLHSLRVILLHWVIVILIAPLGFYWRPVSVLAVLAYALFLSIVFFTKGNRREAMIR
ncbi:MAG: hypothetical protein A2W19_17550 [Spirochaetes bacterium RBG_16_49_21]|nr:MAG: hypothetical protein A2W19_17550 [Spirochaetes bacterium RBG_16_49_21]